VDDGNSLVREQLPKRYLDQFKTGWIYKMSCGSKQQYVD